jgi:hypothetical protein
MMKVYNVCHIANGCLFESVVLAKNTNEAVKIIVNYDSNATNISILELANIDNNSTAAILKTDTQDI